MTTKQMRQLVQAARGISLSYNEGDNISASYLKGVQIAVAALGGCLEVCAFKDRIYRISLSYGGHIEGVLIPDEEEWQKGCEDL